MSYGYEPVKGPSAKNTSDKIKAQGPVETPKESELQWANLNVSMSRIVSAASFASRRGAAAVAGTQAKVNVGTKLSGNMVMGEHGPYHAKIRAMQAEYAKHPDVPVWLKHGARDKAVMVFVFGLAALSVGISGYNMYRIADFDKHWKKLFNIK